MKQYLDLLRNIKNKGTYKEPARENMPGTTSLFGYQMRFDLQEGFPIVTTKKISFKNIVTELIWFLKGDTNIKYLVDNGCNIWNEDAYNYYIKKCNQQGLNRTISFELFCSYIKNAKSLEELTDDSKRNSIVKEALLPLNYTLGDCGKQYGWLWRNWENFEADGTGYASTKENIDQIAELIKGLQNNPMSRRLIITAWNPTTLNEMALNACHSFVQFNCRKIDYDNSDKIFDTLNLDLRQSEVKQAIIDNNLPQYYLDCMFTMRSNDVFLGNSYNVASYALLTHILAKVCNMEVGELIYNGGDVHIYNNHQEQVNIQLEREPYPLPNLKFTRDFTVEDVLAGNLFTSDFELENYISHPSIKAPLSTGLK